ncbi:hypothetical protein ABPG74_021811 [Tetrahymena malaccensis]
MIINLLIGFGVIVFLVLLRITYKTARLYLIYKKKYGNQVKILFYPILGLAYFMENSLKKHDDGYQFLKQIVKENPKVKAIIILSGFMDIFIANDNEWIKYLSQDQKQFYKDDAFFGYDSLHGEGMPFCDYNRWKKQRLFLNSSFHFDALKTRVPILKDEINNFCSFIKPSDGFVKINCYNQLKLITSEFFTRTFFGRPFKDVKCQNGKNISLEICDICSDGYTLRISSLYFIIKAAILGCAKASHILQSQAEKKIMNRIKDLYSIVEGVVDEKISEMSKMEDLIQYKPTNFSELYVKEYLQQQKNIQNYKKEDIISKRELVQQYLTFFFAGTDTTAQLTSMCLYEISKNQQIKEKLLSELKESGKSYENLESSDLQKLPYLDAIIKECNRLYSVIAFLFPRRTDTNYQRGDLYIDKDLLATSRLIQYADEKEFFSESEKFIPERFLNQKNVQQLSPYDMIPFSSGERICIGQNMAIMEAKFLILYILTHFEIAEVPNYKLRMSQFMINQPVDLEIIQIKRI